ncbi:MAG TPA: hypothetical protein VHE30_01420 [Polyangiaceae bacterium]|nr:hypothetical protein [Polyangiaceae bacterium]
MGSPDRASRTGESNSNAVVAALGVLSRAFDAEVGATAIESACRGLLLRLALGASLAGRHRHAGSPGASELRRSLDAAREFGARVGLSSPAFTEDDSPALRAALDDAGVRAALVAATHLDSAPRPLGALHQDLLELEVVALSGPAVRLPTGTWISADLLLRETPAKRSRWLQRAAGLPKAAVGRHARALERAATTDAVVAALLPKRAEDVHRSGAARVVSRGVARRRSGSHYTPDGLRKSVVERAFAPLLAGATEEAILALRVCDPSMGAGDFLETAARHLTAALVEHGAKAGRSLRAVVEQCLRGVDRDAVAVDLARIALSRLAAEDGGAAPNLAASLLVGESTTGAPCTGTEAPPVSDALDFPSVFADVFGSRGGFDACVGNPPWVAYAGRAAQPLAPELARHYERENPAFFGYRTLHGLFVRRSAELLRPGGRLGLVLPTSVADLDGYAPTRAAHDALADVDPELTDFGDGAFPGVFQPCMALTSTRRADGPKRSSPTNRSRSTWSLARSDLDEVAAALLARLSGLPALDATLFGERGFQTTGDDLSHLRKTASPEPPFVVPIREGADVSEFSLGPPKHHLNPTGLTGRLRDPAEFRDVKVLIRQTARYPIAVLSDGLPFRNSVLAGFESAEWPAPAVAAYLNSSVVRWLHFTRYRDARQGMPQLKVGHLRALPRIADPAALDLLRLFGERHATGGALGAAARRELDGIVADAFGLTEAERALVERFRSESPLPVPRRR